MKKLGKRHENLDRKVYHELKSMIVNGKLKPGDKVLQEKVSRELGVSRTPVMGALKQLEQEKFVKAIPRKGYFVRRISKEDALNAYELREMVEGLAVKRASLVITPAQTEKLKGFFKDADVSGSPQSIKHYAEEDRRFHQFLIEIGGFNLLSDILDSYSIIVSYQVGIMGGLVRHPRETLPEHRAMIDAITSGKAEQAEKIVRQHFLLSRQQLLRKIEQDEARQSEKSETMEQDVHVLYPWWGEKVEEGK
jgi:GntR family transcriptional regulator, vanillate catabolism transcriptional regulator